MISTEIAVDMRGIVKRYGPVTANDGVDFLAYRGEVHALLGENGAGKSTLMKILFGLVSPDSGQIVVNGSPVTWRNPLDAMRAGIGMVHQHFMLVDDLTVTENLIAGNEPVRGPWIDRQRARELVQSVADRFSVPIDPDARIADLSVGEQQRVEILKALLRDASVLILDEPTAVLTPPEVEDLFRVMNHLKAQGMTIIFITHKLKETMAISDRVTVLRRGKNVATVPTSETNVRELATMMVGTTLASAATAVESAATESRSADAASSSSSPRPAGTTAATDVTTVTQELDHTPEPIAHSEAKASGDDQSEVLLRIERLKVHDRLGRTKLDDISLFVRAGEIVGIAGVEGNGQLELEEAVTGLIQPSSGWVDIAGEILWPAKRGAKPGPRRFRAYGGAHIPSDRLRRGLVPSFSVMKNAVLGRHYETPLSRKQLQSIAERIVEEYDVRTPSLDVPAAALSGGNQQKLIIGRELASDPKVVVAAQPTRGVDIGAVSRIHAELIAMKAKGTAILIISSELDELLALCDRLAVLYEGQIVAIGPIHEFNETRLGLLMSGARPGDLD